MAKGADIQERTVSYALRAVKLFKYLQARESRYWLTLLLKSSVVAEERLAGLIDETNQIVAILTRIVVNTKNGTRR